MTTLSRTLSLLAARTFLSLAALSLILLSAWTASDLCQRVSAAYEPQKPRVEEEEDTPKPKAPPGKKPRVKEEEEDKPKAKPKKVIRVEEEEGPGGRTANGRPEAPFAGELRQLAEEATHPALKNLFGALMVPHDLIVYRINKGVTHGGDTRQTKIDVVPFAVYLGTHPEKYAKANKPLTFQELEGKSRGKEFTTKPASLAYVRCYEELAQSEVSDFLKDPEHDSERPKTDKRYLSHFDQLAAAQQALSAVLRWHESARETRQRVGAEWNQVEAALRKQLLDDVLLKQMAVLTASRDWEKVTSLAKQLAVLYPKREDRERIARPVADMIQNTLKGEIASDAEKQEARKRLLELERDFPDNPAFKPISEGLREQARQLVQQASALVKDKKDQESIRKAQAWLRQAEEIWPQLQELHTTKLELSRDHPVLRVGVRGQLPMYLSPAMACTDAELRAVELLFESLVKVLPDKSGNLRYAPGLAEHLPTVVPLGRRFQLPRNASWARVQQFGSSRVRGTPLDAGDIRATIRQLKTGAGTGRSRVWGELLDRVDVNDAYQVTLRLNKGYLDPLALMTFKLLPPGEAVDSEKFARNPMGSGPYRFDGQRSDEDQRPCVFFLANPLYRARAGKRDLPRIQEIRFYNYSNDGPVADLLSGKLDLALDLTVDEREKLRQSAGGNIVVPAARTPNRRIYFLAINHGKLPSASLRKAVAHAINREKLLNAHYRGQTPQGAAIHKALNGPFPAGSWACNPNPTLGKRRNKGGLDLFDEAAARTLSGKQGAAAGSLTLKYPSGDPVLEKAMKELCDQVKATTGLVLQPTPLDPIRLREDVEQTQSYDLAYYHYDFPDETYWLWPLLGPSMREGGDSNYFKFSDDKLQSDLKAAMLYRDFSEVRQRQRLVHKRLLAEMPFVPLWQLDPLLAYNAAVQPEKMEPQLVFSNIEQWRIVRSK